MPDATPITARFTGQDLPPGVPVGTALGTLPAPRPAPAFAPAQPSTLADRAKSMYDRALAGMSSLLGREVQPIDRTQQLEKQLDTLQTRSTPNILTTVPRLAPIATPPPPPGTPTTAATPFSYTDWMSKQNAKGT